MNRFWPIVYLFVIYLSSNIAFSQDIVSMIKRVKPAVATVVSYNSFGLEDGEGSGFFIEQNKLITNYHVIDGASSIKIRLNDSSLYPAKYIITQDSALDIAILFIDIPASRKISTISFRPTLPEQGEKIYVVGNPLGLEQSVTDGIVSSIREMKGHGKVIQFSAGISAGNSGSPLLDANGMVLGVARFGLSEGQNLNFAVPADKVLKLKPAAAPIAFVPTVKSYLGKEMPVKDAFTVDTTLMGIPPANLSQREKNIWRLKVSAARARWKQDIIDDNINRIVRAVKRNFESFNMDTDTLTMNQAFVVVRESLGENSAASDFSQEELQKLSSMSSWMLAVALRSAFADKYSVVGSATGTITVQAQEWHDFQKGNSYGIMSAADSTDITDLDVAVFYRDTNGAWIPVASNTQKDWHCFTSFTAPVTGEYAIVWRVAEFVREKSQGMFGSLFIKY
ncbi:MAG: serine protease [Candidatus Kapabacteria bacterium]|nr:serine protease [Candidatus Kapabacteria bacterium]